MTNESRSRRPKTTPTFDAQQLSNSPSQVLRISRTPNCTEKPGNWIHLCNNSTTTNQTSTLVRVTPRMPPYEFNDFLKRSPPVKKRQKQGRKKTRYTAVCFRQRTAREYTSNHFPIGLLAHHDCGMDGGRREKKNTVSIPPSSFLLLLPLLPPRRVSLPILNQRTRWREKREEKGEKML